MTNTHLCTHTLTHTCTHTHTHTHVHVQALTHICTESHTLTHTCICTHIHAHSQTHTYSYTQYAKVDNKEIISSARICTPIRSDQKSVSKETKLRQQKRKKFRPILFDHGG